MQMANIVSYLNGLSENNTREWYHAHKEAYKRASADFEELLGELILRLGRTDPVVLGFYPKELTFRLVRDLRYTKDKSPYNPSFRAHIGPKGKQFIPVGYFLKLRPGGCSMIGGGLFSPSSKDATDRIRDRITSRGEEFERIVTAPGFVSRFALKGEKLKNVPRGYDKEHPQAEYLKYKSWYLERPVSDETLSDPSRLLDEIVPQFEAMQPFNAFLNEALDGFVMPARRY